MDASAVTTIDPAAGRGPARHSGRSPGSSAEDSEERFAVPEDVERSDAGLAARSADPASAGGGAARAEAPDHAWRARVALLREAQAAQLGASRAATMDGGASTREPAGEAPEAPTLEGPSAGAEETPEGRATRDGGARGASAAGTAASEVDPDAPEVDEPGGPRSQSSEVEPEPARGPRQGRAPMAGQAGASGRAPQAGDVGASRPPVRLEARELRGEAGEQRAAQEVAAKGGSRPTGVAADAAAAESADARAAARKDAKADDRVDEARRARRPGEGAPRVGEPAAAAAGVPTQVVTAASAGAAAQEVLDAAAPTGQGATVVLDEGPGGDDAVIRVTDAEVGPLEVRVRRDGQDLSVRVRAEDLGLRQQMLDTLPEIRRELAKAQLVGGRVDVREQTLRAEVEAGGRGPGGGPGEGAAGADQGGRGRGRGGVALGGTEAARAGASPHDSTPQERAPGGRLRVIA